MRSNNIRLNCGTTIPILGFGTYSYENDRHTTEQAIHTALEVFFTHTTNIPCTKRRK